MQRLTSDLRRTILQGLRSQARHASIVVFVLGAAFLTACQGPRTFVPQVMDTTSDRTLRAASQWVIASEPGVRRPPFRFSSVDDRFLDEVARASFNYLWTVCDPLSGMVFDRSSVRIASVAGVGFQLAAFPGAVERGWITREQASERAARILRTLESDPSNRKAGMFYHFVDARTAAPADGDAVSTIDSALLFAGMIVAGEYFGGEVAERCSRLFSAANWSFFVLNDPRPNEPYLKGFVSLGWKPTRFADPTGDGALLPYAWADAADEQRLVCFLAAAAPNPAHRVDPIVYYRLRRMLGESDGSGVHVWFPWSGALFTHFFAQCFIDYAAMGADNPGAHGVPHRPRVDWWENARRGVQLHRAKALRNPLGVPTLGVNAWGLSACDSAGGYAVPGVFPARIPTLDQVPQIDFADFTPKDDFGDGTIAPYAAGCSLLFEPEAAIAALRYYRGLAGSDGRPLVWRELGGGASGGEGGSGFQDSFNLGTNWVAPDCVAIDQGPLVLAIENARSGLVWRLFMRNQWVRDAGNALGLRANRVRPDQTR